MPTPPLRRAKVTYRADVTVTRQVTYDNSDYDYLTATTQLTFHLSADTPGDIGLAIDARIADNFPKEL